MHFWYDFTLTIVQVLGLYLQQWQDKDWKTLGSWDLLLKFLWEMHAVYVGGSNQSKMTVESATVYSLLLFCAGVYSLLLNVLL